MFCSKCGSEMSDGAKFCPKCGAAVAGVMPSGNGSVPMAGNAPQTVAAPQGTAKPQAVAAPQRAAASGGGIKGVWQCFLNVVKTYWSSFICGDKQQRGAYWKSRMGRKDFWSFYVFVYLFGVVFVSLLTAISSAASGIGYFFMVLCYFVLALVGITISARRMHDNGKSFWFVLIPIYGFVLYFLPGTAGDNKFGAKNEGDDGVIKNRKPSKCFIIAGAVAVVLALIVAIGAASFIRKPDGWGIDEYDRLFR